MMGHEIPSVLETVYDAGEFPNPTHGWFATHMHRVEDFPQIVLRDFGIPNALEYVGFVEFCWFNDPKREEQCNGNAHRHMPPKMLFTKPFIDLLPVYFAGEDDPHGIGRLKWYQTIQITSPTTQEQFIHCTSMGLHFVWNLRPKNKASCQNGCHTLGIWLD